MWFLVNLKMFLVIIKFFCWFTQAKFYKPMICWLNMEIGVWRWKNALNCVKCAQITLKNTMHNDKNWMIFGEFKMFWTIIEFFCWFTWVKSYKPMISWLVVKMCVWKWKNALNGQNVHKLCKKTPCILIKIRRFLVKLEVFWMIVEVFCWFTRASVTNTDSTENF